METFSLLTLNSFGAPGMGARPRLRALAQEINGVGYSMVCLQEVQAHRYRLLLTDACRECYPEHAYQHFVHAPKGGLLTLSRLVIIRHEFVLFRERGLWYTPAITDWILHKGVLITHARQGDVPIVVMNTHLTANYTGNWSARSLFARQEERELKQIAELVNEQPENVLVIVCGDFNIPRGSSMYNSLLAHTGLCDPLEGDTRPTFRPHRGMGQHYAAPIDFTLFRAPDSLDLRFESRLRFEHPVNTGGRKQHLSDHLGVELCLSWQ